jgi:hypothetical protein
MRQEEMRKEIQMQQIYEGAVGTAKRVRQILKLKFPKVKFSVRSKSYSGGSSVYVDWTDGPRTEAVERLVKVYEGASFDGMQDLKTYQDVVLVDEKGEMIQVHGADYILCQRAVSPERKAFLDDKMRAYWAEPDKILNGPDYYHWRNEMEKQLEEKGA